MKSEFIVTFSSSDQQAARDGILFALTEVDSASAPGPISHVTTNLLEQLGYLAPNAFGGRTIDPEVDALSPPRSRSSTRANRRSRANTPMSERSNPPPAPTPSGSARQHPRKTHAAFA